MTQTEKAAELIDKFEKQPISIPYAGINYMRPNSAIKCAILAVNEILELNIFWIDESLVTSEPENYKAQDTVEFWEEVLEILEKK